MKNFIIQKNYKWRNYILPIQSFRQFFDTLIIAAVISLFIYLFSNSSLHDLILIFLTSWFFSLLACHMLLPADVIIKSYDLNGDMKIIQDILMIQGYENILSEDNLIYAPIIFGRIPWRGAFGFMIWSENLLKIIIERDLIVIRGPIFMIKIIAEKYALHE